MCGIFGVVLRDPAGRVDPARAIAARDTLIHRGPDEAGLWSRPGALLAHRRLKVLDLTQGQQPAVSPDDRFALVYNGEVYNFQELRSRFEAGGERFHTRCDTEVVLHALNAHGLDALGELHGMFAFGHWDQQRRTLLLARDRLGKKPLYWYADAEQLVFASELKAVLAYLDRRFDIDPVALDCYFGRGYVPAPRTIFKGISKLPAGCALRLDAQAWRFDVASYWDFTPRETPAKPDAVLDELDALLTDAVRRRLVSDVPIGCLLSGGIDSSLVTALASKVSAEPVRAFSIGFDESEAHNELPYAEMVARRHKCLWHSRPVRGDDFLKMLDDVVPFLDEPYGNFTVFSMRKLALLAREELVVVLSGQGGDELAAGYPGRYNWVLQAAAAEGQASRYAPPVDDLVQHLNHSSFVPWRGAREVMLSDGLKEAILHAAGPADDLLPFWGRHAGGGRLNNLLYTDVKTNLADYLIFLEERLTMSASLEARNPLLDDRVVDFMLSLPNAMKVRDGKNKWVLMELARRYVPAEAIDRPKRGFTPPLEKWIAGSSPALAEQFRAAEPLMRAAFSPGWSAFLQAGKYHAGATMPIYYSLMLTRWARQYERYIGDWPGDARAPGRATAGKLEASEPSALPLTAKAPWQGALRTQDPMVLAEARWFCQAMGNFKPGTAVRLRGDDAGWFAFLARGTGLAPAEAENDGHGPMDQVCVGLDAAAGLFSAGAEPPAPNSTLLIFAPFDGAQADRARAVLEGLGKAFVIKGYQAPTLGPDRVLLIVKCQPATGAG